jgi:hypothetical protein
VTRQIHIDFIVEIEPSAHYTERMNPIRNKKLSWLFLAVALLLSVMPFQMVNASGWDEQLVALDDAVIEEISGLSVWLIHATGEPSSSNVQSLHLPALPFHPPA